MKITSLVFLVAFFVACSPKSEQKMVTQEFKESKPVSTEASSTETQIKSPEPYISKVSGPLEIGLEYPGQLTKGQSYSAKINFKAHHDIEILNIDYQSPKTYRGVKPASEKTSRLMKASTQSENRIPFSVQDDLKDGYLVVLVTYSMDDKIMKTSASIRLFADEFLDKGKDIQIKENDGTITNLKVLQN